MWETGGVSSGSGGLRAGGISFIPTQQYRRVNWAAASFCRALSL